MHKQKIEIYLYSPQEQELINGLLVRPLILGDGGYPPTTWQVKAYSFNLNLSDTEKSFNKYLLSARVTVERAFGELKGRWRCLLKCLDKNLELVSSIIINCVLHNICKHDNYINDEDVLESSPKNFASAYQGQYLKSVCKNL